MRMLARGGNAVDAGVAATFAAAVSEISHFGLGGEVPIILYLADRSEAVVINGQGRRRPPRRRALRAASGASRPTGPRPGRCPAVVDALAIALAEFGTLSLAEVLAPAIDARRRVPLVRVPDRTTSRPSSKRRAPSRAGRASYLQGPGGTIPAVGSVFRQPDLARTLRALVDEEQRHLRAGRKAAIYAARDRFYRGDIGQRIAAAVQDGRRPHDGRRPRRLPRAGSSAPTRLAFKTRDGTFEVFKTGFWGQGPVLLQALLLLAGLRPRAHGPQLDRVHPHGDGGAQARARRPRRVLRRPGLREGARGGAAVGGLCGRAAEAHRSARGRQLGQRPGRSVAVRAAVRERGHPARGVARRRTRCAGGRPSRRHGSPDTTTVNVADARGNLFSASPSSAWFFGGVFIAGDTGVPLGNRMQAFVLDEASPERGRRAASGHAPR